MQCTVWAQTSPECSFSIEACRLLHPRYLRPQVSFGLSDDHGNAVDEEYQIKTLSSVEARSGKFPLIGLHVMIISQILDEEEYVDIITVLAKKIEILFEEQPA